MASAQRTPRDIPFEADAEYQRLVEQHRQYEAELQKISKSPYLNSEDLLEEIKLKKMKLHCKDEMERIAGGPRQDEDDNRQDGESHQRLNQPREDEPDQATCPTPARRRTGRT